MVKPRLFLILILLFALVTRVWQLSYPSGYYFDEVYNAFTTLEFVKGQKIAYEWFHTSPVQGTAYGWTHPPLAKLLSAVGILLFGSHEIGWRIVNAVIGVGVVYLVYHLALLLLKSKQLALVAALFAACDGLLLVQSRINMNDIVATFFILLSFAAFVAYQKKASKFNLLRLGLVLGLLVATKWTGLYAIALFGVWIGLNNLTQLRKWPQILAALLIIPAAIYLLSYSQYFVLGGTWTNFLELQKQMWLYNTRLTATHTYQSPWWSWPLLLRPVWYFVDYSQSGMLANIYALGNPALWWLSIPAVLYTAYQALKTKAWHLGIILAGYATFWLPWARAPRIMFLYHFLPSVPFMCIALAFALSRLPKWCTLVSSILILGSFIYFYPHWIAIHLPINFSQSYFWLPSWK